MAEFNAILTPLAVLLPTLMTVAKAVADFPTCAERLLGRTAATKAVEETWRIKLAVTDVLPASVSTHEAAPLHAPLQPAKLDPLAGVAVRVTTCPLL